MQHVKKATTVRTTTSSLTTTTTRTSTTDPPASSRRARGGAAALALVGALAACGGGSAVSGSGDGADEARAERLGRRAGAPRAVPVRPIQIHVSPRRSGGSLEVAIEVIGRGRQEGEAFEDASGWDIEARDDRGQVLRRIMNGPGSVERNPVGVEDGSQWDVRVRGTVFFALPSDVTRVAVRVSVPKARPVVIRSEVR